MSAPVKPVDLFPPAFSLLTLVRLKLNPLQEAYFSGTWHHVGILNRKQSNYSSFWSQWGKESSQKNPIKQHIKSGFAASHASEMRRRQNIHQDIKCWVKEISTLEW